MGGIPPQSALCVMCITPRLMELWQHCLQDVGKLPFAFPHAVNGVVHSGMASLS